MPGEDLSPAYSRCLLRGGVSVAEQGLVGELTLAPVEEVSEEETVQVRASGREQWRVWFVFV